MGGSEHRSPERCSGCEMVARWFLQVTNTNLFLFFFLCACLCVCFFYPAPSMEKTFTVKFLGPFAICHFIFLTEMFFEGIPS